MDHIKKHFSAVMLIVILGLQVFYLIESKHTASLVDMILERMDIVSEKTTDYDCNGVAKSLTTVQQQGESFAAFLARHDQELTDSKKHDGCP